MKSWMVTGGAGFIGSHVVERLLKDGKKIVVYDNFTTGYPRHLKAALATGRVRVVRGDLGDARRLKSAMKGVEFVVHLAANADVRHGVEKPGRDLQENTIGTFRVLEAMRANGVKNVAFSSTGSVYGEAPVIPTPENCPFPIQTSLYGASKVAGEALLQAHAEGFGFRCWIFRFVSILGERYSHGHVLDFYAQLRADPRRLRVLGDGHQRKSYLYVGDCVEAIMTAVRRAKDKVNIYNLGANEYCEVRDSARWICAHLGLKPKLEYAGGKRGWIGDNPFIYLDCAKIRSLGWKPRNSIRGSVEKTLDYLRENSWLMDRRGR